jgi:hypothetical protein
MKNGAGQAIKTEAVSKNNEAQHPLVSGLPLAPSATAIQTQLEKILAHPDFTRSERLSRFLRFAVEQTLQGQPEKLKEYSLGVAVFDRNSDYDTRLDPIVRVEAARLRTKLKEYYANEGRNDPILIDICKGGYIPIFQSQGVAPAMLPTASTIRTLPDWKIIALVAAVLVISLVLVWAGFLYRRNLALQRQIEAAKVTASDLAIAPVWSQFFAPDAPTYVIFGSPVFFTSQRQGFFLRRPDLNDPASLAGDAKYQALQERFGPIEGPRYDYAEMGDTIALQRLTAFFGRGGKLITALPAHVATWESIKDGNLIFLGAPRMDPLLRKLPVQQDFEWGLDSKLYNRRPLPGEQSVYTTEDHRDAITYEVIACFPGLSPNRKIMLLTAHSAPGTMAVVEYATHAENLRALTEKLQLSATSNGPQSYQVLLRTYVDKGMPVKTEYVTHHLVPTSVVR